MPAAGGFEVYLPDLHTGATDLSTDAADTTSHTADASTWITTASTAAGTDPLLSALAQLATDLATRGAATANDLDAAAALLISNATRYTDDDTAAATAFTTWTPGTAETYTAPSTGLGLGLDAFTTTFPSTTTNTQMPAHPTWTW